MTVFLVTFAVYTFPLAYDLFHKPFFNWSPAQDIVSTSFLPVEILERGDFTLERYRGFISKTFQDPHFVAEVNGRLVSRSPVMAAVLAIPFYGAPLGIGWIKDTGREWLVFPESAFFPGKFAAAMMSALAVLMFFYCSRELVDTKTSAALALVFAFGTSVWSTASQGLWQQTPSVLFQLIGLWFILRGARTGGTSVAPGAFFFSAATVARPNNAIPALLFTVYVLLYHRPALTRWILWSIPPAIFFFVYNAIYNGSPFVFGYQDGVGQYLRLPQIEAFLGLTLSPSRGLFIYSPFFIFVPIGYINTLGKPLERFYRFCALALGAGVILLSMWSEWDGGWGYGTRMLTDLLPYMSLLLVPVLPLFDRVPRAAFWTMVIYAVVVHSFSLWDYGTRWHWHWDNYRYNVWDLAENEPLYYFKQYWEMALHFVGRLHA